MSADSRRKGHASMRALPFDAGMLPAVDGSLPLLTFFEQTVPPEASRKTLQNSRTAVHHFAKFLGRPPCLADLTADVLSGLLAALLASGRSSATVEDLRGRLLALARAAVAAGALAAVPCVTAIPVETTVRTPWTLPELNRLLVSARTMPGDIGPLPANLWWSSLILTVLDTQASVPAALEAPRTAYDPRAGMLTLGLFVYALHPLTIERLSRLVPYGADRLFPWPLDNGRPPFHMLHREFKTVLYRADLAHVAANQFDRLRLTARTHDDILSTVDLDFPFRPREGKPKLPRARDRRAEAAARDPLSANAKPVKKAKQQKIAFPTVYQLTALDPERTLLHFFETLYRPRRLANASPCSIADHRHVIHRLCEFCACEVTLEQLSDELLESFAVWLLQRNAPESVNGSLAVLLAQWRYAYKKRKVDELPRDVEKFATPTRIPEAWSQEELGQILDASATEPGTVGGMAAGQFWPALILSLYDTGLRIQAVLTLKSSALDLRNGWLKCPADFQKQNAEQVFHLSAETLRLIAATRPAEREHLFPSPYSDSNPLRKRYRKILKRAGLPAGPRDLFHKLRRTSATFVADAAGDEAAQRHLGHSTVKLTRKNYIDPRKVRKRVISADAIDRPVWKSVEGVPN